MNRDRRSYTEEQQKEFVQKAIELKKTGMPYHIASIQLGIAKDSLYKYIKRHSPEHFVGRKLTPKELPSSDGASIPDAPKRIYTKKEPQMIQVAAVVPKKSKLMALVGDSETVIDGLKQIFDLD